MKMQGHYMKKFGFKKYYADKISSGLFAYLNPFDQYLLHKQQQLLFSANNAISEAFS